MLYNQFVISLILMMGCISVASAQDIPGSEDHPIITRYPGSVITWYEVQEFERYQIAIAPLTGYRKIDDWVETEGRVSRINYVLTGDRSMTEVYSNYVSALKNAGFTILADGISPTGRGNEIGSRTFMGVHYAQNPFPPGASRIMEGSATSGGSAFAAAELKRVEDTVYVTLSAAQYKEDEVVVLLDIIEQKAMEDDLVFVDAEAMGKDIDIYGKVALYGIFFDHNKATIKDESEAALKEIASLLTARPELSVYVVGHTDITGSLEYNINLSKQRAQSVIDTLVKDYGIAVNRLEAHGVGPLVPVATNQSDPGKAKNRRVELVEK